MTVSELIKKLQDCNPDAEVRMAQQPNYPLETAISGIYEYEDEDEDEDDSNILYLVEGQQLGYLPGAASQCFRGCY